MFRQLSLQRRVGAIGLAISVAIAASVPLLEAVRTYGEQQSSAALKARFTADTLSRQVADQRRLRPAESVSLADLVRPKDVEGREIRQRVLDRHGTIVIEGGPALPWPVLTARAPIQIRGDTVGTVEVDASLSPFLRHMGLAALAGTLLGLLAFFAACVLPLRILERKLRAMAEIMAQHASAEAVQPSEALATLGREVRRPLRGIAGTASLLLATPLSAEQRRHVQSIQECSDALLGLIGDVLEPSEREAGRLDLEASAFSLVELAESVIDVVEPDARPRDLIVVLSASAQLPARVLGDPVRLRQVLLSLMGNAIKFTDRGAVVLKVFPHRARDLIRFEVHDTGVGIPAATRNRLFHEPGHGEASLKRRHRGPGLGLGICTRLVAAMGGDIGFESEPGEGSIFWFEVPLPPAMEGASSSPSPVLGGTRRRAVLLAPRGPAREGARELLASLGFEVMAPDAAGVSDCDIAVIHHSALPQVPFSRRGKNGARPWLVFGFGACRWSRNVEGVIDGALKPSELADVLATILGRAAPKAWPQPGTLREPEEGKWPPFPDVPPGPEWDRFTLDRSRPDRRHVA